MPRLPNCFKLFASSPCCGEKDEGNVHASIKLPPRPASRRIGLPIGEGGKGPPAPSLEDSLPSLRDSPPPPLSLLHEKYWSYYPPLVGGLCVDDEFDDDQSGSPTTPSTVPSPEKKSPPLFFKAPPPPPESPKIETPTPAPPAEPSPAPPIAMVPEKIEPKVEAPPREPTPPLSPAESIAPASPLLPPAPPPPAVRPDPLPSPRKASSTTTAAASSPAEPPQSPPPLPPAPPSAMSSLRSVTLPIPSKRTPPVPDTKIREMDPMLLRSWSNTTPPSRKSIKASLLDVLIPFISRLDEAAKILPEDAVPLTYRRLTEKGVASGSDSPSSSGSLTVRKQAGYLFLHSADGSPNTRFNRIAIYPSEGASENECPSTNRALFECPLDSIVSVQRPVGFRDKYVERDLTDEEMRNTTIVVVQDPVTPEKHQHIALTFEDIYYRDMTHVALGILRETCPVGLCWMPLFSAGRSRTRRSISSSSTGPVSIPVFEGDQAPVFMRRHRRHYNQPHTAAPRWPRVMERRRRRRRQMGSDGEVVVHYPRPSPSAQLGRFYMGNLEALRGGLPLKLPRKHSKKRHLASRPLNVRMAEESRSVDYARRPKGLRFARAACCCASMTIDRPDTPLPTYKKNFESPLSDETTSLTSTTRATQTDSSTMTPLSSEQVGRPFLLQGRMISLSMSSRPLRNAAVSSSFDLQMPRRTATFHQQSYSNSSSSINGAIRSRTSQWSMSSRSVPSSGGPKSVRDLIKQFEKAPPFQQKLKEPLPPPAPSPPPSPKPPPAVAPPPPTEKKGISPLPSTSSVKTLGTHFSQYTSSSSLQDLLTEFSEDEVDPKAIRIYRDK